ncbi:hypothetical protein [Methanolobus chelungpuianus]|uniref:EF-hand domain-containing protein n=1 Tax=Methanolobus chelungpuianus TaxID=502115 RepID=A0AAE3KY48_9EURY|nr:hypothetical protein [Methanolobus chelungpuianus]MCQ6963367.1 hypothetical protein [Methanolobus chelungpuianus]
MSTKNILLFLIICCCLTATVSAEVSFTNYIELYDDKIIFTVGETYTSEDALAFRENLDADNDGNINVSEIELFKEHYLSNGGEQFLEYIAVDDGSVGLSIESIEMEFNDAAGSLDGSDLNVATKILYLLNSTLSSGEHKIWVLGEYRIEEVRFVLPAGVGLVTYDGLENATLTKQDNKILLKGESGVTSYMIGDVQRIESASIVWIKEEPFYEHRLFLPLLILVEVMLGATALYIIRHNKNK